MTRKIMYFVLFASSRK